MGPEFQEIGDDFRELLAGRSTGWCQRHPLEDERRWNAQQVIEHLVLAQRSAGRVVEARLESGRVTRRRCSLGQWVLQFLILKRKRMPLGAPAPPFARPGLLRWPPMNGEELAGVLRRETEATEALLARCEQRFGKRVAASHFLLGPLNAEQWRTFHAVHCRHHLEQLRRIETALKAVPDSGSLAKAEQAGTQTPAGL